MSITEIVFYLNLASAALAAMAVICAIAATVITVLYRPFRPEADIVTAPVEILQEQKRKRVISCIEQDDLQTMMRLFEIPNVDPAGWMGSPEGKETKL